MWIVDVWWPDRICAASERAVLIGMANPWVLPEVLAAVSMPITWSLEL